MGNILFQNNQSKSNNSIINLIQQAKQMGPSGTVYSQLYASNPRFRDFANTMQVKGPEQAFREAGLDFNQFKPYKW